MPAGGSIKIFFAVAQERYEQVKSALLPFLRTSGFRESAVQWLPAVGPTAQNLTGPPAEPALSSWWPGPPSVVDAIDAFRLAARPTGRPLRMPIADVFKGPRGGLSIGGKLEGGALKVSEPYLFRISLMAGWSGFHFMYTGLLLPSCSACAGVKVENNQEQTSTEFSPNIVTQQAGGGAL